MIHRLSDYCKDYLYQYKKKIVLTIKPVTHNGKSVLISYITAPFISHRNITEHSHTNYLECKTVVQYFLNNGYLVDIINWDNDVFFPSRKYDVIFDIHSNIDRLYSHLQPNTIKILYATGAHWLYQNLAEYQRIDELKQRRNVSLIPQRQTPPCHSAEKSDHIIILGKQSAYRSFLFAQKPLHSVNLFSALMQDWNGCKNFETSRNNFLWIGTSGLVHKGLDLVLEVFSQMPMNNLYVCGDISAEKDFQNAYYQELYHTPNIFTTGWIDIHTTKFQNILSKCISIVYPSCSEGQSGSVITCMHGGLIPIISSSCGIDIQDNGIIINNICIDDIKNAILKINSMEEEKLKKMARKSWEYAMKEHTLEKYQEKMGDILDNILINE